MYPIDSAGPLLATLIAFVIGGWALVSLAAAHRRRRRFDRRPSAGRLEALGRATRGGRRG